MYIKLKKDVYIMKTVIITDEVDECMDRVRQGREVMAESSTGFVMEKGDKVLVVDDNRNLREIMADVVINETNDRTLTDKPARIGSVKVDLG